MHSMQSGGWPYSKLGRNSSKAPSLRAAVFHSKILRSDRISLIVASSLQKPSSFLLNCVIDNEAAPVINPCN